MLPGGMSGGDVACGIEEGEEAATGLSTVVVLSSAGFMRGSSRIVDRVIVLYGVLNHGIL